MGHRDQVQQQDAPADVVVLEACNMLGERINGAHRVPKKDVKRVSPSADTNGATSTVKLEDGEIISVFLTAAETSALLGWP